MGAESSSSGKDGFTPIGELKQQVFVIHLMFLH
jgi:hypothetical protein